MDRGCTADHHQTVVYEYRQRSESLKVVRNHRVGCTSFGVGGRMEARPLATALVAALPVHWKAGKMKIQPPQVPFPLPDRFPRKGVRTGGYRGVEGGVQHHLLVHAPDGAQRTTPNAIRQALFLARRRSNKTTKNDAVCATCHSDGDSQRQGSLRDTKPLPCQPHRCRTRCLRRELLCDT